MEKYARQALQEGVKDERELLVNDDHELYRVLNVHYNRNNHIEVSTGYKLIFPNCRSNYEIYLQDTIYKVHLKVFILQIN